MRWVIDRALYVTGHMGMNRETHLYCSHTFILPFSLQSIPLDSDRRLYIQIQPMEAMIGRPGQKKNNPYQSWTSKTSPNT